MRTILVVFLSLLGATAVESGEVPHRDAEHRLAAAASESAQKRAILAAVRSLHKLSSAVKVGLSFSQYTDRVTDMVLELDQQLGGSGIPQTPITRAITGSMNATNR